MNDNLFIGDGCESITIENQRECSFKNAITVKHNVQINISDETGNHEKSHSVDLTPDYNKLSVQDLTNESSNENSLSSDIIQQSNSNEKSGNKGRKKLRKKRNRSATNLHTSINENNLKESTGKSSSLVNVNLSNNAATDNHSSSGMDNTNDPKYPVFADQVFLKSQLFSYDDSTLDQIDHKVLSEDKLYRNLLTVFPDKRARIVIITWNMACISDYPENLSGLFQDRDKGEMCDLYLLTFQETTSNKTELLTRIQLTLGVQYVIYDYIENKKLLSVLIGHKRFIWDVGIIGMDFLSTRMTTTTKGVAAISFYFFGSSFLFLGSHFSSDAGKNNLRLEDYHSIFYSTDLIKSLTQKSQKLANDGNNLSYYFDYTIWAGDLNFRIDLEDSKVRSLINQEAQHKTGLAIEYLLENDELINSQINGTNFEEFEEGRIRFLPTYKYLINTNEYNKIRTPSYTDRILFKNKNYSGMEYLSYSSIDSFNYSDHRPVMLVVEVDIDPHLNEYLKSSGKFNKEIYDKCFTSFESKLNQPNECHNATTNSNLGSKTCSIQ